MILHKTAKAFLEQGVEIDPVDEIQGIKYVALGLRHLLSILITNQAVNIDFMERHIVHEFQAHHDHPRNPEKNDVEAGNQDVARIEGLE